MELVDDGYCFCCGKNNPISLKLQFIQEGEEIITHFTPGKEYQGYADVIHGGILTTIMDETMAKVIIAGGELGVTVKLEVVFLKPAKPGDKLTFCARKVSDKRNFREMSARAVNDDGETLVEATALFKVIGKVESVISDQ